MKNIFEESQDDRDEELFRYTGVPVRVLKEMKIGSQSSIKLFRDEDIERDSFDFIYEDYKYLEIEEYLRTLSALTVSRRSGYIKVLHKYMGKMEGKRILDFGSGVGSHGIYCAQMGAEVDFLDVAGPLFDYTKWRVEDRNIKNVNFLYPNSILKLEEYDAIICLDVLEHIANPGEVFLNLVSSLKLGGLLSLEVSTMVKPKSGHFSQNIKAWWKGDIKHLNNNFEKVETSLYKRCEAKT